MANIVKADWEEMVFEDREKTYGAYMLRKKYPAHLFSGLLMVALLFMGVGTYPVLAHHLGWDKVKILPPEEKEVIVIFDTPPPIDEKNPPSEPPPLLPPLEVKVVAYQIPEPTAMEDLIDDEPQTIATIETLKEAPNLGTKDSDGLDIGALFKGDGADGGVVPDVIKETEPAADVFVSVDEVPKAINLGDLVNLIGYPQMARDSGIEGLVTVRVLVDKKGHYRKHKMLNGIHPLLSERVEKFISKLEFTPAIQGNRPVMFWVNIPFNFKLQK
ncbi:MAG: energy transducer TonB [Bacteroidota bacterium]